MITTENNNPFNSAGCSKRLVQQACKHLMHRADKKVREYDHALKTLLTSDVQQPSASVDWNLAYGLLCSKILGMLKKAASGVLPSLPDLRAHRLAALRGVRAHVL